MDNNEINDNEAKGREPGVKKVYSNGTIAYENYHMPIWYVKSRNAINYVLGVIEVLLLFRFLFMLLGANPRSGFVAFLYSITGILTAPFSGIFNSFTTNGLAARSVFDPATIIGMIVYAIAAWGLIHLIRLKAVRDGH